jgi:hypothetical protein
MIGGAERRRIGRWTAAFGLVQRVWLRLLPYKSEISRAWEATMGSEMGDTLSPRR